MTNDQAEKRSIYAMIQDGMIRTAREILNSAGPNQAKVAELMTDSELLEVFNTLEQLSDADDRPGMKIYIFGDFDPETEDFCTLDTILTPETKERITAKFGKDFVA